MIPSVPRNDVHRYLGASSLTARAISELPRSVVVIATMSASHHTLYTTNLEHEATRAPDRWRDLVPAAKAVALFTKVSMARRWSPEELNRAAELNDPRLRRAAEHGDLVNSHDQSVVRPDAYDSKPRYMTAHQR